MEQQTDKQPHSLKWEDLKGTKTILRCASISEWRAVARICDNDMLGDYTAFFKSQPCISLSYAVGQLSFGSESWYHKFMPDHAIISASAFIAANTSNPLSDQSGDREETELIIIRDTPEMRESFPHMIGCTVEAVILDENTYMIPVSSGMANPIPKSCADVYVEPEPAGKKILHTGATVASIDTSLAVSKGAQEIMNDMLYTDTAWPVFSVLKKLAFAGDVLLNEKDYDRQGWEEISHCVRLAKEMSAKLENCYFASSIDQYASERMAGFAEWFGSKGYHFNETNRCWFRLTKPTESFTTSQLLSLYQDFINQNDKG